MTLLQRMVARRPFLKAAAAAMMPGFVSRDASASTFKTFAAPSEARLLPLRVGRDHDLSYVNEEIVCQRPVRIGGIRVEAEDRDGKAVVHCYGHGGSGWTLAPGTSKQAVQLLEQRLAGAWSAFRGADVVIIGAGIVGQMCAYHLHQLRKEQPGLVGSVEMVAERSEGITSDNAGGLFEPVLFGRNVIQKQSFLDSYRFYRDISLGRNPAFPQYEAELLPVFATSTSAPTQELIELGEIPPAVRMNVRINNNVHKWSMTQLFYMNVRPFNRLLSQTLRDWGIPLQTGVSVRSFDTVSAPIVFNCTGLGAGQLCDDEDVVPFTGHLVTFRDQPRGLLDVANTQFVEAGQVPAVLTALDAFDTAFVDSGLPLSDPDANDALGRLRQAHRDIRQRLAKPVKEADPDWTGVERVRLFETSISRTAVVFDHSRVIAATASESMPERHAAAVAAYASMVNLAMKRYMFGIIEDYPTGESCDDCATSYAADSYAFPLLQARLQQAADGGYHYLGEPDAQQGVNVFVAGGTYIEGSDLPPARDAEEFKQILDRLRFLGFR